MVFAHPPALTNGVGSTVKTSLRTVSDTKVSIAAFGEAETSRRPSR
jgi:hypothetical protein